MEQGFLFETRRDVLKGESEYVRPNDRNEGEHIPPIDPNAIEPDKPRLTGQNAAILQLLRAGPRTNTELAQASLKYTSRISDLRAAGFSIDCHRGTGGLNIYTLTEEPRCSATTSSR